MATDEKVDFGDDAQDETPPVLEEKYREQMRQIVTQKIDLPLSTLPAMIKDQIALNPDFQRRDRWDGRKQSRFIESVIMNVPIPPVFLGEDEYGKYVVLDGRQRLTALSDFMANRYQLVGLKVWSELNKYRFNDLEKKGLDTALTRRFVPAVVILKESSPQVKYDVFDRLNTGGVIAEPMEIRNAIYRGKFNRLLHELSGHPVFRRLWDIPAEDNARSENSLYQKMQDVEFVLRYFALRDNGEMKFKFRDHLSEFMNQRNKDYDADQKLEQADREGFQRAVNGCWTVFGNTAFRRPDQPAGQGKKSVPLSDAVMVAMSDVATDVLAKVSKDKIKKAVEDLCVKNESFRKAISAGTNGKGAIETRIKLAREAVGAAIGQ